MHREQMLNEVEGAIGSGGVYLDPLQGRMKMGTDVDLGKLDLFLRRLLLFAWFFIVLIGSVVSGWAQDYHQCDDCYTVSEKFYECGHFDPNNPNEPCSEDYCIADVMLTASCVYRPNGLPGSDCNTVQTFLPEVIQILYKTDKPCKTTHPGGFHDWVYLWYSNCETCTAAPQRTYQVRCDTDPCSGERIEDTGRNNMYVCGSCP